MKTFDPVSMARLSAEIVESDSERQTIEQLVAAAIETIEVAHGGVTLLGGRGGKLVSMGTTGPQVQQADDLQHELVEGPCVETAVTGRIVWSDDLRDDERWPRWGPQVASLGFRRILSAELHDRHRRIGALNLYGTEVRDFTADERDLASMLARQAAAAFSRLRTEHDLLEALSTRTLIGQATGIMMERFAIDADRAFEVLRRYSQDYNIKLRDLAQQLVEYRDLPLEQSASPK